MTDRATKLDVFKHMRAGSPLARMAEQAESAAAILPQMAQPTKWLPPLETSKMKVTQPT